MGPLSRAHLDEEQWVMSFDISDTTICWTFLLVDGFPAEFYKIFKEDLMLINIPQTIPQYRIIKNIVPIKWHNYPDIQIT